jgi:hypothetical protein
VKPETLAPMLPSGLVSSPGPAFGPTRIHQGMEQYHRFHRIMPGNQYRLFLMAVAFPVMPGLTGLTVSLSLGATRAPAAN